MNSHGSNRLNRLNRPNRLNRLKRINVLNGRDGTQWDMFVMKVMIDVAGCKRARRDQVNTNRTALFGGYSGTVGAYRATEGADSQG